MTYYQRRGNKERHCKQCDKIFVSKTHGGTKEFCSYSCSNIFKWKTRDKKPGKRKLIECKQCNKEFEKLESSWKRLSIRYCSPQCVGLAKRKRDEFKDRHERYRRKKGMLKEHTPEWLDLIRSKTKDAMLKPEINEKLRKPRKPLTPEHKAKISDIHKGKLPANLNFSHNGSFPNVKRGDYDINGITIYFRSRWEANYALYLDFLVKQGQLQKWEYEKDVFIFDKIRFGTRSYRPDFKIFNNDSSIEYHEIKGYMDGRSKTKLKRMTKYYPEVKLILIDRVIYMEIVRKLGRMLSFYGV